MGFKLELPFFVFLFHLFITLVSTTGRLVNNEVKVAATAGSVLDITKFGAQPDSDATQALLDAWKEACAATSSSTIEVPAGSYTLGPIQFLGPCKGPITMVLSGNFTAPADLGPFKGHDTWIRFQDVQGLTIHTKPGGGGFDGQGQTAWKQNQCASKNDCDGIPYNFRFDFVSSSVVSGITSLNSKSFHMAVLGCTDFTLTGVKIIAPGDSPNTDGIHIGRSDRVNITNTHIGTGDDCISIGDGSQNLNIKKVTCDPGHGISIGSLGLYPDEKKVTGVTVRGCTINNAQNGVRIKTYQSSYPCEASKLHFEDITMNQVWYPIIVDQEYCPHGHCKAEVPSKVKITDIRFKNIKGTATMKEAVRLICSSSLPCQNVELTDVDLTYNGKDGPAVSMCKYVKPTVAGTINPPACDAPATPSNSANA